MEFYVKDIMTTDLVTVNENTTIRELIKVFADYSILGVPVVDNEGYISGVVSTSDVLKNESSHTFYHAPFMNNIEATLFEDSKFFDQPVTTIMTNDLYSISPDDSISKMAKTMYEKKIHRLLVIEFDKLIGVVSTYDLLKLMATSEEKITG